MLRRIDAAWPIMSNLLVVDDDEDIAQALSELLDAEGHTVQVAHDGIEALACLQRAEVDLILLDVEMPRLTGPEMVYELLVINAGKEKIPIVLLSGDLDLPRTAAAVGTPYYLAKPYPIDDLFSLMARALAERTPPAPLIARAVRERGPQAER
jgi:CheY-like chemotaxis protein